MTESVVDVEAVKAARQHLLNVRTARQELGLTLNSLRYSSQMSSSPPMDPEMTEVEYLVHLNEWLTDYGDVLTRVGETTTEMARELHELRQQRSVIRLFFGMPASGPAGIDLTA